MPHLGQRSLPAVYPSKGSVAIYLFRCLEMADDSYRKPPAVKLGIKGMQHAA